MNEHKIVDGLNFFNEKADKLFRPSFVKTMFGERTGVSVSGSRADDDRFDVVCQRTGPDEEAIDAFVLTFRFFIQNNEKSSFANLANYYSSSHIDRSLGSEFEVVRQKINEFLDKPGIIQFKFNNEILTRRIIMDTFIYGGLSHGNDDKKKQYDAWQQIPPLKQLLENEFVCILAIILRAIKHISVLNVKALEHLKPK
jgi:hypothetical protein